MIPTQAPQPYAPVILKLLQGVIYHDDPPYWNKLQEHLTAVQDYFGKIGLQVRNYETEGFAYLEQPDPDPEDSEPSLPRLTIRRQLSFKVTMLCILLREQLRLFDSSDATGRLVLSIEALRDLIQPYLLEQNNEEKFRQEVDGLIKQAIDLGFLKRLTGQDENYNVRPIVKAKIDAEMLERLKQKLEGYAKTSTP